MANALIQRRRFIADPNRRSASTSASVCAPSITIKASASDDGPGEARKADWARCQSPPLGAGASAAGGRGVAAATTGAGADPVPGGVDGSGADAADGWLGGAVEARTTGAGAGAAGAGAGVGTVP